MEVGLAKGGAMDPTRKLYRSKTTASWPGYVVTWPSTSTLTQP
jgi:hypothetical protein